MMKHMLKFSVCPIAGSGLGLLALGLVSCSTNTAVPDWVDAASLACGTVCLVFVMGRNAH
jgi:hypothetical protein